MIILQVLLVIWAIITIIVIASFINYMIHDNWTPRDEELDED